MNLKLFFSLILSCSLLSVSLYEDATIVQPVSAEPSEKMFQMSVAKGEVAELSARQFEIRLGLEDGDLAGITITSLPKSGSLILDGARLSEFSRLTREELDRLCFVPGESAVRSGFSFLPDCADRSAATLYVCVTDDLPSPPQAEDICLSTWSDVGIQACPFPDSQIQPAFVHITRSPQKGVAQTDGQSISYLPFRKAVGEDCFSYVLVDAFGNLSNEATVTVTIQENKNHFSFSDMAGHAEEAAAITLHQSGILCGEKIGDAWYFHPDSVMTRGQFLICLLAAKGVSPADQAVIQTGLANDRDLPLWIKPYLQTAIRQKIITETVFFPGEPVSVLEAEELLRRSFDPSWKKAAFSSLLTALGKSSFQALSPDQADTFLTRADCAVLLSKMTNNFPS